MNFVSIFDKVVWQSCLAKLFGKVVWQSCLAKMFGKDVWQRCLAKMFDKHHLVHNSHHSFTFPVVFYQFSMPTLFPATYPIKRALISVSDKTGIIEFAHALTKRGIEIISTGGTASALAAAGVPVRSVSEVTGFPEILDGRVKTLHPSIHAGLLGVLDNPDHERQMAEHGVTSIDLVVINLYPFEQTLAKPDATHEDIVENIDIGGPAMVRASAKNYRWTAVVTNPLRYADILSTLETNSGAIPENLRLQLAREAFAHMGYYDSVIARYLEQKVSTTTSNQAASPLHDFPETFSIALRREQALRYGENPHQTAALYTLQGLGTSYGTVYKQLHGKELSYNNILDIDGAARLALEFMGEAGHETVVIVKHTNPCGVGSAPTLAEAYKIAYSCDTASAFGGIIAFTAPIDLATAQTLDDLFTEVLIAPAYSADALELLQKKKNRRLMTIDYTALRRSLSLELKAVGGGLLAQRADVLLWNEAEMRAVTKRQPTAGEWQALRYAWKIAKHVKSNAIVYAAPHQALAVGAGQMSRVDSAAIAARKAEKANISLKGSAVASDAFFPFADGLLEAVEAGATAVIQPGGSVRDEEVIAAADERGIAMVFTGVRHFKH
jgi:phosphoribosylaminoimidazolecarboxamide formyltransferase/IMP cyclohydrolase